MRAKKWAIAAVTGAEEMFRFPTQLLVVSGAHPVRVVIRLLPLGKKLLALVNHVTLGGF